jgi:dolichyl-diphosphooligosaccharide--protein glycosyltransferase
LADARPEAPRWRGGHRVSEASRRPRRDAIALLCICAIGFALRASGFEWVFVGDEVHLVIGDGHYHARMALYSLANFPSLLGFDPYVKFPDGAAPQTPPFPAWVLAALAQLLGGAPATLERVLAWWSVVLGSVLPLPVYFAARVVGGRAVALAAAALAASLPLLVSIGSVGEADHHAAQSLLGANWLLCSLRLAAGTGGWGAATGLAATRFAMLAAWSGSMLYLVVADGLLFLTGVLTGRTGLLRLQGFGALATAVGVVPLIALLPPPATGSYSMVALSHMHPLVLVALAGVALAAAWRERHASARSTTARLAETLALSLLGLGVLLALPGPRESLLLALAFFRLTGGSQVLVAELLPLFPIFGRPAGVHPPAFYGGFAYAIPLAPVAVALAARRAKHPAAAWLLCGWTTVLGALAVGQVRFGTDFAASASIGFALGLAQLTSLLRRMQLQRSVAAALVIGLAVALLASPIRSSYAPAALGSLRALTGEIHLGDRALSTPGGSLIRFLQEVRRLTPETSGYLDASTTPEYGVLCSASLGHTLHYVARRASSADGFLHTVGRERYLATLRFFAARDEAEALHIARDLGSRYAIVSFPPQRAFEQRLYQVGRGPSAGRPLEQFRLIAEGPRGGRPLSELFGLLAPRAVVPHRLFEIVEGAQLEVRGTPGQAVSASLALNAPLVGAFEWRTRTMVGEDGLATLRVPYPTESRSPTYARGPYQIQAGPRRYRVAVSEDDVRHGRVILVAPRRGAS